MRFDRTDRQNARWLIAFALCVLGLVAPAIYNRFPLLFPDSDAYFEVAYGHQWTLDRSGFYGLFLKPFVMPWTGATGIWVAIAAEAAIVTVILFATVRRLAPKISPWSCAALILLTALLSSLPWHTAQIMPDAFTGALIMLIWFAASRDPGKQGSALLWLAVGALALLHYTHLPLLAITAAATLIVTATSGIPLRRIGRRGAAAVITIMAVVATHVTANGLMFGRWTVSPVGGWFLFARVHEDGLARDWLTRHCGRDAPAPLCNIAPSLPNDSQALLWSRSSPLRPYIQGQIATPNYWKWMDMLSRAAIGGIREEPGAFLRNSAVATVRQVVTFEVLDDHCPAECQSPSLIGYRPHIVSSLRSSGQLAGTMPKAAVRDATTAAESIALLALIPLMLLAVRRRDFEAQAFLAAVIAALLGNAAIAGALSDVQPRYQSRVAWLAVFASLTIIVRWRGRGQKAKGRDVPN